MLHSLQLESKNTLAASGVKTADKKRIKAPK